MGKKALRKFLTLTGLFVMVMIFAGIVGRTEAKAAITKQVKVVFKDDDNKIIPNNKVELSVGTWTTASDYTPGQITTNENDEIICTVSGEEWHIVSFQVQAQGYRSKTVSTYWQARNNINAANNGGDQRGQFCWYLMKEEGAFPTDVTIYLETYTETAQKSDYRSAALTEIDNYALANEYSKTSENEDGLTDQEQVNAYVTTYKTEINKILLTLSVDEYKAAVDEQVEAAKNAIKMVRTKQSRMNEQYGDKIKFKKGNKVVDLTKNTTKENQTVCSIYLHKFDQNGKFYIEGIGDSGITWDAVDHNYPLYQGLNQYVYYISNYLDSKGEFMTDPQQSLYDQKRQVTLKDCYASFSDSEGNPVKVTFDLTVTTCNIENITATLSANITGNNNYIQLQRNEDLDYTTRIVKADSTVPEGSYTYSVSVNADEEGYVGGYDLSSGNEAIATVENGVIVPKKAGTCTFTATSQDDSSKTDSFTITFTLDETETLEQAAAQPVINLITEISEKGEITSNNKDEVSAAVKTAETEYGKLSAGAKKKVDNYDALLDAKYRLEAYPVIEAIKKIDIETISGDNRDAIEVDINKAREQYDALSSDAKRKVTNSNDLTNAENVLEAWDVDTLINAIPAENNITADLDVESDINAARSAYDAYLVKYSADNKVSQAKVLENAENTLAARKIEGYISDLKNVVNNAIQAERKTATGTDEAKEIINDANTKVGNVLTAYNNLEAAKDKVNSDSKEKLTYYGNVIAALVVENEINALGEITLENLTPGQIAAINNAYTHFLQLSELRQGLVDGAACAKLDDALATISANEFKKKVDTALEAAKEIDIYNLENADDVLQTLIDLQNYELADNVSAKLEAVFEEISSARTEISDVKAAAKVVEQIDALGTITLNSENKVKLARTAYDTLTTNGRAKVANYSVLTAAESRVTLLKEAARQAQEAANAQKNQAAATPAVTLSKISLKVKTTKGKVKLSWKKSSKAQGYIIYRATKKNGTYKKIKTITKWKTTSFTDKKVKSKKQYYYKICPYKGNVKGPLSAAKKIKVK